MDVSTNSNLYRFQTNDVSQIASSQKKSIDVPFYITRDSLKGQLYNADELMKDFYGKTDQAKEYSGFMKQLSLFTRWYSWESGINNRFGNTPDLMSGIS